MIEGPLAAVLAANRERLNARVAAARMSGRGVDATELRQLLQSAVAPAVDALNVNDAAAAERAALALIELSIDLLATDVGVFRADLQGMDRKEKDLAIERLRLPVTDPKAMPPARLRVLTEEARQRAIDALRQ